MCRIATTSLVGVVLVALAALVLVVTPAPTAAAPGQEPPPTPGAGEVAADVDLFKADDGDVVKALTDLQGNLRTQLRKLEAGRADLEAARADEKRADRAVAATNKRVDDLTARSDSVVVDAFVNPPADTAFDALALASPADASLKASIVGMRHDADAAILQQLHEAREQLDARTAAQQDAAGTATAKAEEAAAALADLEAAQSQEAAFVLEVQARLDQNLAEAEALASIDPVLARQLKAQASEIARRLDAIRTAKEQRKALEALHKAQADAERRAAEAQAAALAASPGSLGPASGSLSTVACPGGGSITVDSSLASNLSGLLAAASAAGFDMCGGGYRDPAEQIALRRAHCGSSDYAIYQAPSSACSPPTAKPGTSMHEQGLAIDFTCGGSTVSGGSACFAWLEGHAAAYGLHNLPGEPWHWSTDGT